MLSLVAVYYICNPQLSDSRISKSCAIASRTSNS